jgi:hypothetical protein
MYNMTSYSSTTVISHHSISSPVNITNSDIHARKRRDDTVLQLPAAKVPEFQNVIVMCKHDKAVPVHTMKPYRQNTHVGLIMVDLSTRWT